MTVETDSKAIFDAAAFEKDIKDARDAKKPSETEEEKNIAKLELWTTALGVIGFLLCVRGPISLLGMIALAYYKYAKFAILAHHTLHGGWGINRRGWFAQGLYRRIVDWLDWIFPMAWIVEHNKVHHYYLNEDTDPDFVERNTEAVHSMDVPMSAKYSIVAIQALIWKWWYYASNTAKTLHAEEPDAPTKEDLDQPITMNALVYMLNDPWYRRLALDFVTRIVGPTFAINFVAIPVVAGLMHGSYFSWTALLNIMGAEAITNVHAFCTIVTNHAGSDMWHFTGSCKCDTAEFYLRAVLGSVAYPAGNDLIDYFHGYLNYQCEHHAFPALSPLHYQRLHPLFKQVCAKHGVPYIQENIIVRTKKTADVIVGVAKHKRLTGQACDQPDLWMVKKYEK
jgi:fatty acid desaturase